MHSLVPVRALSALALTLAASAVAAAATSTADEQASLSMTVYQQGFSLVRDVRTVELGLGRQVLNVADISNQIIAESALVSGDALTLHAANYSGSSLTPENLLNRYVGKTVRVLYDDPPPGAPGEESGVLLSAAGGVPVVRIGDRVEIGGPEAPWRIAFAEVPGDLHGLPTLSLDLESSARGPQSLSLTYLTNGVSWQADYVGTLQGADKMVFSGWVSVRNDTTTSFRDANVRLLAGDVNQPDQIMRMKSDMVRMAEAAPADMARQSLADYHLYQLPEPLTLQPEQRRQVRLLAPKTIPVEREYRVEGDAVRHVPEEEDVPVAIRLHLTNDKPALGVPLPGGTVRVYAEGPQGHPQFLGEDRINHTAQGQELKLRVGNAFDIAAKRTTLNYRRVDPQTAELEQQIRLINRKRQPVTVVVAERLPGDWEILSSNHQHRKVSAQLAEWRVEVAAGAEVRLTYRARVRY